MAICVMRSTRRSPRPKPRSIWRATCKRRSPRRCVTARFSPPNLTDDFRPSWTSPSTLAQGGCGRRRYGGASTSVIGQQLLQSYADGSMEAGKCCRGSSIAERPRLLGCFSKFNPEMCEKHHSSEYGKTKEKHVTPCADFTLARPP